MVDQPQPTPVVRHAYSTGNYHVSQKYMDNLRTRYADWLVYKKKNSHRPGDIATVNYINTVAVSPESTGTRRAYQTASYTYISSNSNNKHQLLY